MNVWTPMWVSLHAALDATIVTTVLGIALGYLLARSRIPGLGILEAIATLPVALPPTVMGYYLLVQLGRDGEVSHLFGHQLSFTFTGIVIAQIVESFPYSLRACRAAFATVDTRYEQAARSIGLPGWRVFLQVTLPLARSGIVTGVAMAFGRALGDFGATIAVSNGPRSTTMPIALYDEVFNGSPAVAEKLAAIQISFAIVIMLGASWLGGRKAWATAT